MKSLRDPAYKLVAFVYQNPVKGLFQTASSGERINYRLKDRLKIKALNSDDP